MHERKRQWGCGGAGRKWVGRNDGGWSLRCVVLAHSRENAGRHAEALSLVFLILSSSLNEYGVSGCRRLKEGT